MIILKNVKWIILVSLLSIILGILTFFTFINQSFIHLNDANLQILLLLDLGLVLLFFILIIRETLKIIYERKSKTVGSKTSLRYIRFFSISTLLPSLLIAFFSLILFNLGLQKYFDKKIRSAVNNSYDVAKKYVQETRNSVEADALLVAIDINRNAYLFYDDLNKFKKIVKSQRQIRKLDEIYLLDSGANIIISELIDTTKNFVPPTEEALNKAISGLPIKITDAITNRTSALIKLNNYIDVYLYIVKYLDPKLINYLKETEQAINFYYSVENNKTGIKITFALIYVIIVTLLLFLSVILAINFASRLTLPIINLIRASEKISLGNLDEKVPEIESDEEFYILNKNFNSMINKLQKQQDKLLISERHIAWEHVARKLAHEIKNPLTPIQLSIDRIKEKYLSQVKHDQKNFINYLTTINKQIKDIENLLNEFSDFARMPGPIFKQIDLKKVLMRSVQLNVSSNQNIKINLKDKNNSNYMMSGDEDQMNRVFLNLIKNSIESIEDKLNKTVSFKGKIDVEIYSDKDYIYIIIEDNGSGFDTSNIKKMLTPYFTTKKNGTGLGLAIVNKIINEHDGNIHFKSNNGGARVQIIIPKRK